MKKIMIIAFLAMLVNAFFAHSFDPDCVARVRYKCSFNLPGSSVWGGARWILWCDILSVNDEGAFRKVCERISEDGRRANIKGEISEKSEDRCYYVYPTSVGGHEAVLETSERSYVLRNIVRIICCFIGITVIMVFYERLM